VPIDTLNVPRYDACKRIREIEGMDGDQPIALRQSQIFADAMWVSLPLLTSGHSLLESDVTVRLRVAKSYKIGYSPAFYKDKTNFYSDTAIAPAAVNRNLPMYTFGTDGIATICSKMTWHTGAGSDRCGSQSILCIF